MRGRAAALGQASPAIRSGPRCVVKPIKAQKRKPNQPGDRSQTAIRSTKPAIPRPMARVPQGKRRYVVVEHREDLADVVRIIGEFSTLELAQALLQSEIEWGNASVVILDQRAGEAILDSTASPVRVSLPAPRGRRARSG